MNFTKVLFCSITLLFAIHTQAGLIELDLSGTFEAVSVYDGRTDNYVYVPERNFRFRILFDESISSFYQRDNVSSSYNRGYSYIYDTEFYLDDLLQDTSAYGKTAFAQASEGFDDFLSIGINLHNPSSAIEYADGLPLTRALFSLRDDFFSANSTPNWDYLLEGNNIDGININASVPSTSSLNPGDDFNFNHFREIHSNLLISAAVRWVAPGQTELSAISVLEPSGFGLSLLALMGLFVTRTKALI